MRGALRLLAVLLGVAATTLSLGGTAQAHQMSTSAVLVDIGSHQVTTEVQLPIDRLAFGLGRPYTPANILSAANQRVLEPYVAQHISATGKDEQAWRTSVADPRVESVDRTPHLVYTVTLSPPGEKVTSFDLHYDVLIEQLVTHKALATVRTHVEDGVLSEDGSESKPLGVFGYGTDELQVNTDGSAAQAFVSMAQLGITHVSEGSDHLLFLLTLLLPAPLLALGGRWRRSDQPRQAVRRVLHVVTAFALGHSITLALAAFDVIDLPTAPIEVLVALSIAVSALHAIRPLVPGGEARIAFAFGLVHGVAFAEVLGSLGLAGGDLVVALLGFNLGIELTQLMVVALVMPSLWVLSGTRAYPAIRTGVGVIAFCAAIGWGLERTGAIATSPLQWLTEGVIAQPMTTVAALALIAFVARIADRSFAGRGAGTAVQAAS